MAEQDEDGPGATASSSSASASAWPLQDERVPQKRARIPQGASMEFDEEDDGGIFAQPVRVHPGKSTACAECGTRFTMNRYTYVYRMAKWKQNKHERNHMREMPRKNATG